MKPLKTLRATAALLFSLALPASVVSQAPPDAIPNQQALQNVGWVGVNRSPKALLAEHRRLAAALAALKPQRRGTVDAYVVVAALDSDPVFGREAREAGRVLARRFDAAGRTIVLTEDEGEAPGSPANLAVALARVAELANKTEDVLILYTTSHGNARNGLAYRDPARGFGSIPPARLAALLNELGMANRFVMLSACYTGVFVPALASNTSVVMTAAAADRPSFGCSPGNDWTYFGDALINRALRKPQPLAVALTEAGASIGGWETAGKLQPSNPQVSMGKDVGRWLGALEKRMPKSAGRPVGRSPVGTAASN